MAGANLEIAVMCNEDLPAREKRPYPGEEAIDLVAIDEDRGRALDDRKVVRVQ